MTISYLKTSAEEAVKEMRKLDYTPEYVTACEDEFSRFTRWITESGVNDFDESVFEDYALSEFGVNLEERKKLETSKERRRAYIKKLQNFINNGTPVAPKGLCRKEFYGKYAIILMSILRVSGRHIGQQQLLQSIIIFMYLLSSSISMTSISIASTQMNWKNSLNR